MLKGSAWWQVAENVLRDGFYRDPELQIIAHPALLPVRLLLGSREGRSSKRDRRLAFLNSSHSRFGNPDKRTRLFVRGSIDGTAPTWRGCPGDLVGATVAATSGFVTV
jgi:hypothetical protein